MSRSEAERKDIIWMLVFICMRSHNLVVYCESYKLYLSTVLKSCDDVTCSSAFHCRYKVFLDVSDRHGQILQRQGSSDRGFQGPSCVPHQICGIVYQIRVDNSNSKVFYQR